MLGYRDTAIFRTQNPIASAVGAVLSDSAEWLGWEHDAMLVAQIGSRRARNPGLQQIAWCAGYPMAAMVTLSWSWCLSSGQLKSRNMMKWLRDFSS
ncbi:hypothetical protein FQN50_007634 [Emmonsiellopsis sp. PD_5]|nr:hypothetical protein FQN50_007634 [Emmonsiellopsis sp. PD_5]